MAICSSEYVCSRWSGASFAEATAVEPRGRITPRCLGIWTDEQANALKPITSFISSTGSVPGIQIAHAGRKAWQVRPGMVESLLTSATALGVIWLAGSRSVAVPLADGWQTPKAMSEAEISELVGAFADSARRSAEAGFKVLEIHGAHGYLTQFLSPLSNQRNDKYGGDLEGRMRFALEVAKAVRASWPKELPLFLGSLQLIIMVGNLTTRRPRKGFEINRG